MQAGRLNLAYISPLNPIPSGLSDYSETLVPALADLVDITFYTPAESPTNELIAGRFVVRPIDSLGRHRTEHDLRLYQLGNSAQNEKLFEAARRMPGVVTLHEPFLHSGIRGISRAHYIRELRYEFGDRAETVEEQCGGELDPKRLLGYPLIARVVDESLGIVVHSRAARQIVERYQVAHPTGSRRTPIAVIPHLMPLPETGAPQAYRAEFGLPSRALILGIAGLVDPIKEPELAVQALAQVIPAVPETRLVFMGELPGWYTRLPALVRELGLESRVVFLGRLDPLERLHRAMAACDVMINLRQPTLGETSGTALWTMALGRPLIVRGIGWYGELPDGACIKIGPGAGAEELADVMLRLARSESLRQTLGREGRRSVQSECSVAAVAQRYTEFLEHVRREVLASMDGDGARGERA